MDSASLYEEQPPEVTLTASLEWSILQGIGASTVQRWARRRRPVPYRARRNDNDLAFLETDLRRLLGEKLVERLLNNTLPQAAFDTLQERLKPLCSHLEHYANSSMVDKDNLDEDTTARYSPAGGDDDDTVTYPRLRALWKLLRTEPGIANSSELDLVNGPNQALFLVPPGQPAKETLAAVHSCNLFLETLLKDVGNGDYRPFIQTHQAVATSCSRFVKRASNVLDILLKQYSDCESAHEVPVLLSLPGDLEASRMASNPILDMLLSGCSCLNKWQKAQCLPYQDGLSKRFQAREIQNICHELQIRQKGTILTLFHEHNGLFSAHERDQYPPLEYHFDECLLQSFDHLIKTGAFRRPSLDDFRRLAVFSPKEKTMLALRLAQCLMEFFTKPAKPSWDNKKVFMFQPPGGLLYMSFAAAREEQESRPSTPSIQIGEPDLVAFAKLLLEIDSGEPIDLNHCKDPIERWATVCVRAKKAQDAGGGLYAEAVKGALYLHNKELAEEDPETALRHAMEEGIVSLLKTAANPPTAAAAGIKRRFSVSDNGCAVQTPIQMRYAAESGAGAGNHAPPRAAESPARSKRQRTEEPQEQMSTTTNGSTVFHAQPEASLHSRKPPNSREWLKNLKLINAEVERERRKNNIQHPIRVAILDTGFDPSLPCFRDGGFDMGSIIEHEKDFVDDGAEKALDLFGHGTYMVKLIMECAPSARLIIARVAESTNTLEGSQEKVAKAILWAGCECKADIVSMSFGFPKDSEAISRAIEQVQATRHGSVILLASAGNSSLEKESFPARHPSVISIQATDHNGIFAESNVRSSPSKHGPAVLGTFGDGIPSNTYRDIDEKYPNVCQPGSSVATAVAAAISATMLAYITVLPVLANRGAAGDGEGVFPSNRVLSRLWGVRGMDALFRHEAMAHETASRRWFVDPVWFWKHKPDHHARYSTIFDCLLEVDQALESVPEEVAALRTAVQHHLHAVSLYDPH